MTHGEVAAMNKPTIPFAVERLKCYYALPHRGMGGVVHVITEDTNVSQSIADSCLATALDGSWTHKWGGNVHQAEDIAIAKMLASMSATQRRKLSVAHAFYPEHVSQWGMTYKEKWPPELGGPIFSAGTTIQLIRLEDYEAARGEAAMLRWQLLELSQSRGITIGQGFGDSYSNPEKYSRAHEQDVLFVHEGGVDSDGKEWRWSKSTGLIIDWDPTWPFWRRLIAHIKARLGGIK